jgi:hypothetical protein
MLSRCAQTVDLIPEISVILYREGESPEAALAEARALEDEFLEEEAVSFADVVIEDFEEDHEDEPAEENVELSEVEESEEVSEE